ncbi:MAG: hypothetical protein VSS52_002505, partial [Thiotrichaceae bacterium]|nr:hypothetical protein [Thiotrichaceae bacterium]
PTKLSVKGNKVVCVLDNIITPKFEDYPTERVLKNILDKIKDFRILYPLEFVIFLKQELNVIIGKISYHAYANIMEYQLSVEEYNLYAQRRKNDKVNILFSIFEDIRELLTYLPISELHLMYKTKTIKVKNKHQFDFIDIYTTFDIKAVIKEIEQFKSYLDNDVNDLDGIFHNAFNNYFLKNREAAGNLFKYTSRQYFLDKKYVSSLISIFNKKHTYSGLINLPEDEEECFKLLEIMYGEFLPKNDDIAQIFQKFPKNITNKQNSLLYSLDANNSLLLKALRDIVYLKQEIENQVEGIKEGQGISSIRINPIYNKARGITLFILQNQLAVLYSEEYLNISKIAFESCFKWTLFEEEGSRNMSKACINAGEIQRPEQKNIIRLDEFLAFWAIISFKKDALYDFIRRNIKLIESGETYIEIDDKTRNYLFKALDNSIESILLNYSSDMTEQSIQTWKNTIILLAYVKHDVETTTVIMERFTQSFKVTQWFELSETINVFIAIKFKLDGNRFSPESLEQLFTKQIEKLNIYLLTNQTIPLPVQNKTSILFLNLSFLNKDANGDSLIAENGDLNRQLTEFIYRLSQIEGISNQKLLENFVSAIYQISGGTLQEKAKELMDKNHWKIPELPEENSEK